MSYHHLLFPEASLEKHPNSKQVSSATAAPEI